MFLSIGLPWNVVISFNYHVIFWFLLYLMIFFPIIALFITFTIVVCMCVSNFYIFFEGGALSSSLYYRPFIFIFFFPFLCSFTLDSEPVFEMCPSYNLSCFLYSPCGFIWAISVFPLQFFIHHSHLHLILLTFRSWLFPS